MTAAREAIYLPSLFLTVCSSAASGQARRWSWRRHRSSHWSSRCCSRRAGAERRLRSAAGDERVALRARQSERQGVGGGALVASAQVFSLLTPEAGLPRVLFSLYFLVLMINTMAAGPDRVRVLRSLAVTFGAAFVLKFIVLDALADPAGGRLTRLLQVLFEGVTLGALTQDVQHPAAGYLAFLVTSLFLAAVALLPSAQRYESRAIVVREADLPEA